MNLITLAQMRQLQEAWDARCAMRVAARLRRHFPARAEAATEEQLQAFALRCIARARELGLRQEAEFRRYAHLAILLGPGFERSEGARLLGLAPRPGEDDGGEWLYRAGERLVRLLRERAAG